MSVQLLQGDCLELMRELPDNSVDLIATDPPYYKVKGEAWDRQWDTPELFIAWIGKLCAEWQRILKPNGSLYVFASPRMAARVEVEVGHWFNVLANITWAKPEPTSEINYGAGNGGRMSKEALRTYYPNTEHVIFAEHFNADNAPKGEAGYAAKCDTLRGFLFEPLRKYLDDERIRAGVTPEDINEALGFRRQGGMAGRHYFNKSQWCLPTSAHYQKMRDAMSQLDHGGAYLAREWQELQSEYEALKVQFETEREPLEALRRPFSVSPDVPYTNVWTFKTVNAYAGKHPCEKPLDMMRHIIMASSKPNAVVLDCFMGSGVTGQAARELGRDFIGMELDPKYFAQAKTRIETAQQAFELEATP